MSTDKLLKLKTYAKRSPIINSPAAVWNISEAVSPHPIDMKVTRLLSPRLPASFKPMIEKENDINLIVSTAISENKRSSKSVSSKSHDTVRKEDVTVETATIQNQQADMHTATRKRKKLSSIKDSISLIGIKDNLKSKINAKKSKTALINSNIKRMKSNIVAARPYTPPMQFIPLAPPLGTQLSLSDSEDNEWPDLNIYDNSNRYKKIKKHIINKNKKH